MEQWDIASTKSWLEAEALEFYPMEWNSKMGDWSAINWVFQSCILIYEITASSFQGEKEIWK